MTVQAMYAGTQPYKMSGVGYEVEGEILQNEQPVEVWWQIFNHSGGTALGNSFAHLADTDFAVKHGECCHPQGNSRL
jgi:hypothetical protein